MQLADRRNSSQATGSGPVSASPSIGSVLIMQQLHGLPMYASRSIVSARLGCLSSQVPASFGAVL